MPKRQGAQLSDLKMKVGAARTASRVQQPVAVGEHDDLNGAGSNTHSAIDAHLADTNNPHEVTPAQIGAATEADLAAHVADTDNPHSVTYDQTGAAAAGHGHPAPAWDDITGKPSTFPPSSHNHDDRYFQESEHIAASGGSGDAGKPIITDAAGKLDASLIPASGGTDVAAAINAAAGKTTPHDNDELGLVDTEASNVLKKLTWANLKAAIQSAFNSIFLVKAGLSGGQTASGGTASGNNLVLRSTTHATKGAVVLSDDGGVVYIGHTSPIGVIREHVKASVASFDYSAMVERNGGSPVASSILGALALMATNSVAAGNGFGPALDFHLNDSDTGAVLNLVARLAAVRNGADNTADLILSCASAGVLSEIVRIRNGGLVGVKNPSPDHMLHVGDNGMGGGFSAEIAAESSAGRKAILQALDAGNFIGVGSKSSHNFGVIVGDSLSANFHTNRGVAFVGTGSSFAPSATVSLQAGSSADHANVGGTIYVSTADTANSSGSDLDTVSFSVPANTLAQNGDFLEVHIWGTTPASTGDLDTPRMKLNASYAYMFPSAGIGASQEWEFKARIVRTGSSSVKAISTLTWMIAVDFGAGGQTTLTRYYSGSPGSLGSALTIGFGHFATMSASEYTVRGFVVKWYPNNT